MFLAMITYYNNSHMIAFILASIGKLDSLQEK